MNQMETLPLSRKEGGIEEENKGKGVMREKEATEGKGERREGGDQEATKDLSDPKEP
jgi:hypothetical protein